MNDLPGYCNCTIVVNRLMMRTWPVASLPGNGGSRIADLLLHEWSHNNAPSVAVRFKIHGLANLLPVVHPSSPRSRLVLGAVVAFAFAVDCY